MHKNKKNMRSCKECNSIELWYLLILSRIEIDLIKELKNFRQSISFESFGFIIITINIGVSAHINLYSNIFEKRECNFEKLL